MQQRVPPIAVHRGHAKRLPVLAKGHGSVWVKPSAEELLLTGCFEALERDPQDAAAHGRLGSFLYQRHPGRRREAMRHVEAAAIGALGSPACDPALGGDGLIQPEELPLLRMLFDGHHARWLQVRSGGAGGASPLPRTHREAARLVRALRWGRELVLRQLRGLPPPAAGQSPRRGTALVPPRNAHASSPALLGELLAMTAELGLCIGQQHVGDGVGVGEVLGPLGVAGAGLAGAAGLSTLFFRGCAEHPHFALAVSQAASLMLHVGQLARAEEYLRALLDHAPPPLRETDVQMRLARVLMEKGDRAGADACMRELFSSLRRADAAAEGGAGGAPRAAALPPVGEGAGEAEWLRGGALWSQALRMRRATPLRSHARFSEAEEDAAAARAAARAASATTRTAKRGGGGGGGGGGGHSAAQHHVKLERWERWCAEPRTWAEASRRFLALADPLAALDAARHAAALARRHGLSAAHALAADPSSSGSRCVSGGALAVPPQPEDDLVPLMLLLVAQCWLGLGDRFEACVAAADALQAGPCCLPLHAWLLAAPPELLGQEGSAGGGGGGGGGGGDEGDSADDEQDRGAHSDHPFCPPIGDEQLPATREQQVALDEHQALEDSPPHPANKAAVRHAANVARAAAKAGRQAAAHPTFREALARTAAAATRIQALARRGLAAMRLKRVRVGQHAGSRTYRKAAEVQAHVRGLFGRKRAGAVRAAQAEQVAAVRMQAGLRGWKHRAQIARAGACEAGATALAAWARGEQVRRRGGRAVPVCGEALAWLVDRASEGEERRQRYCGAVRLQSLARGAAQRARYGAWTWASHAIGRVMRGAVARRRLREDPRRRRWCTRGVWPVDPQEAAAQARSAAEAKAAAKALRDGGAPLGRRVRKFSWQVKEADPAEEERRWRGAAWTRAGYVSVMGECVDQGSAAARGGRGGSGGLAALGGAEVGGHWSPFCITSDQEVAALLTVGHLLVVSSPCFALPDAQRLGHALRRYRPRLTLHTLMLYGCRFGDEGLAALCSALAHAPPPRRAGAGGQAAAAAAAVSPLRCLGLGGNGITAAGAAALAAALAPSNAEEGGGGVRLGQLSGLRKLFVEEQPAMGGAGLARLLPAVAAGVPGLTHLQLTRLGAGDGAAAALRGLRLPALRLLGLRHNGFTDGGGAALVDALHAGGAARGLEVLWLGGNGRLGARTATALASALRIATVPSAAASLPPSPAASPAAKRRQSPSSPLAKTPQQSDDDEAAAAGAAAAAAAAAVAAPAGADTAPPDSPPVDAVTAGQALSMSWRHALQIELPPPVAAAPALPLKEIELSGTGIGDDGAAAIAAALMGRPAPVASSRRGRHVQQRGGAADETGECYDAGVVAAALAGCKLERLALSACPSLTAAGVEALVAAQSELQRAAQERGGMMSQLAVLVVDKLRPPPPPLAADEVAVAESGTWQPAWLAKHAANSVR